VNDIVRLVVADIGATNGRFAIAERDATGAAALFRIAVFENDDFPDFAALIGHYLDNLPDAVPPWACFAVAGPCDGRRGFMVNRDWAVDAGEIESGTALNRVSLVNDFAALAAEVPYLHDGEYRVLHEGERAAGPLSVVGPGTGLGVAQLVPGEEEYRVIDTEGGHMAFAPRTPMERELLAFLSPADGHVAVEELLSGRGLENIHRFLSERVPGARASATAAEISAAALGGGDPLCRRVVDAFLAILGGALGDIALVHGATGGVYLGGGIPPRLEPLIGESRLLERFRRKGPLESYLRGIPLRLITADFLALRGAARLFGRQPEIRLRLFSSASKK